MEHIGIEGLFDAEVHALEGGEPKRLSVGGIPEGLRDVTEVKRVGVQSVVSYDRQIGPVRTERCGNRDVLHRCRRGSPGIEAIAARAALVRCISTGERPGRSRISRPRSSIVSTSNPIGPLAVVSPTFSACLMVSSQIVSLT